MIISNINLSVEDADKIFLPHRDVDQSNYRVGILNGSVVVWNPESNKFMDFFYDDLLTQEWFNLSLIGEKDTYKINRDGIVIGPRKQLTVLYDPWGYPQYKISGKHYRIHKLLAKIFIPNIEPERKIVIDHIDRNKNNYNLRNLKWASIKENSNNIFRPSWTGRYCFNAYSDPNLKNLVMKLTDEDLYNKFSGETRRRILKNKKLSKIKSFYWSVDNLELLDYLKLINESDIDDSLWVEHYSGKFKVHPLGLIKGRNGVTPGSIPSNKNFHPERRFTSFGVIHRVHKVVAEVFLNDNKPINKGLVIDHINTNPLDNRVINLRICTQSENMNNTLTKQKLSRKVVGPDGEIYDSITKCAAHYNVKVSAIWAKLNGVRPSHGFKYYDNEN